MHTTQVINGPAQEGDWVIVAKGNYAHIIGKVTAISPAGTKESKLVTNKDSDIVHVDFTAYEHPRQRIAEIEDYFSNFAGAPVRFEKMHMDDILCTPDFLISLSFLGNDMDKIKMFGDSAEGCEAFCDMWLGKYKVEEMETKEDLLVKILQKEKELTAELAKKAASANQYDEGLYYKQLRKQLDVLITLMLEGRQLSAENLHAIQSYNQPLTTLMGSSFIDAETAYFNAVIKCIKEAANYMAGIKEND